MVNRITRKSKGGNKNTTLKKLGGDDGEKDGNNSSLFSRFMDRFKGSKKPPLSRQEGEYGPNAFSENKPMSGKGQFGSDQEQGVREEREARQHEREQEATRRDAAEAVEQKRIADIVTPIVKKEVFAEVGQSLKGINDRVEKLEADINMLQGKKEEPVSAVKPVSTEEGEEEQVTAVVEEPVSKVEEDDGDDDVMNQ